MIRGRSTQLPTQPTVSEYCPICHAALYLRVEYPEGVLGDRRLRTLCCDNQGCRWCQSLLATPQAHGAAGAGKLTPLWPGR